jgi:hypothetical protein
MHPASIIGTNTDASHLRRFIDCNPLDQAGVIILPTRVLMGQQVIPFDG